MRKNRIYTIKERKKKKKLRLATFITVGVVVATAVVFALTVSLDTSALIAGAQNVFSSFDFFSPKAAQKNDSTESQNQAASEEENTAETINLTMDVLSQDLEPVDPSVGSKIWAAKETPVFSDQTLTRQIGSIVPETMYEVVESLEIANKPYFKIDTAFGSGYVEADECLINLKDYLGTDQQINLVNTENSPIKVCGFPINGITGETVVGIEDVEGINKEEKILLLYPTAAKLKKATELAKEKGYILSVYETVRTDETVEFLHKTMLEQLDKPVGQKTYNGVDIRDYFEENKEALEVAGINTELAVSVDSEIQAKWARAWYNSALENQGSSEAEAVKAKLANGNYEIIVKNLPEGGRVDGKGYIHTADGTEVLDDKGYWTWADFDVKELPTYKDADGNVISANSYGITFKDLMIKDGISLEKYFEKSDSDYSKGLAVDVVLLNTETDNEIAMQTAIYDMSLMSNPALNNDNAKVLEEIMTEAGFEADAYVWWHFINADTKKS